MVSRKFRTFFAAVAELRKATTSFLISVRLHGTNRHGFSRNLTFECFFENLPEDFKFYSILTRIAGTLHVKVCTVITIFRLILLRMRNVSNVVEKIKTHFMLSKYFLKYGTKKGW